MGRVLIPREHLRPITGRKCPKCGHHRHEWTTGLTAGILMRYAGLKCKRCGTPSLYVE